MCCRKPLSWLLHVLFLEPSLSVCGGPRSSAWQEIVCACLRLLTSALEPHMQNHTSFSYCTAYASLRKQHKQNRREQNFPIQTRTVVCHFHESHKSSQFLPTNNKLLLFFVILIILHDDFLKIIFFLPYCRKKQKMFQCLYI